MKLESTHGCFKIGGSVVSQMGQRLQTVTGRLAPQGAKTADQDRVMPRASVPPQMPSDHRGRGVVLVEQEGRDPIRALGRMVADQPVDGPVTDLGIVRAGELHEIVK